MRIKAQNTLDEKGTLKGSFTIEAEGQSDSNIRRIFTTGFQSEWAHSMERQLLNVSPKAQLLSVDYGREPKEYQKAPIRITFHYAIPEYAMKGEQGELIFKSFVLNNLYTQVLSYLRIDTRLEKRDYGFKDGCSRLVEMEDNLKLPAGYKWQGKENRTRWTVRVPDSPEA